MIDVENLSRSYGNFQAVDQVSFTINKGEIVGLLGHNGAGKTTIMKMLTGYLEPTGGSIRINGASVDRDLRKTQGMIGYLPENCPVYPEMTVIDYLDYLATLHGVPKNRRADLVFSAMAGTEVTDKAQQPISTLSRGYRQRIGVAQAILHEPDILILDEPTNGLDPTQIQHMRALIKNLSRHSTIIISTHILQEVQAICDRAIIIKNGRKVVDSHLKELQEEARLLLKSDLPPAQAGPIIRSLAGVADLQEITPAENEPGFCYSMALSGEVDRFQTTAELVKMVQNDGWKIFGCHPQNRDLETVFAEISA